MHTTTRRVVVALCIVQFTSGGTFTRENWTESFNMYKSFRASTYEVKFRPNTAI